MTSFTSPQEQHRGEKGVKQFRSTRTLQLHRPILMIVADQGGKANNILVSQASRGGVEEQINTMDAMTSSQRHGKKI